MTEVIGTIFNKTYGTKLICLQTWPENSYIESTESLVSLSSGRFLPQDRSTIVAEIKQYSDKLPYKTLNTAFAHQMST
jgi:hypothetical protein